MKLPDAQLKRVHSAKQTGTTLKEVARQMGWDYQRLAKQYKAWRIRNGIVKERIKQ